jgi:hypothetical protein
MLGARRTARRKVELRNNFGVGNFGSANRRLAFDKPIIFYFSALTFGIFNSHRFFRNKMSSVKRRKIEEDRSLGPVNIKKKQKGASPPPATTSASPEPAQFKDTSSNQEPQKDAPIQKSFKDLVCPSIPVDNL